MWQSGKKGSTRKQNNNQPNQLPSNPRQFKPNQNQTIMKHTLKKVPKPFDPLDLNPILWIDASDGVKRTIWGREYLRNKVNGPIKRGLIYLGLIRHGGIDVNQHLAELVFCKNEIKKERRRRIEKYFMDKWNIKSK